MDNIEFDFRMLFTILRRHLLLIILATVIFGFGAYTYAAYCIAPTYTATVKMFVYSNTDRANNDSSITSSELTASQSLVNTYLVVLESNTVLNKVIEKLELPFSPGYIRSMMSAAPINDTEVFYVSITSTDAQLSQNLANTIAEVAPDEIVRVVKAGGVEVVDPADLPTYPSSPNVQKITIIGAVLGFLVSFGALFLAAVLDTRVHGEDDLLKTFKIPLLGSIPTITVVENSEKKGESVHGNA